jgi:probable F420-dependent oxidoreductase
MPLPGWLRPAYAPGVTGARPFRFAVQAVHATSAGEWRDFARTVEDLGYSTLFVADHYLDHGPAAQDLGPIAAMATAAAVTTTLRIGCRVFCVDYHQPAALAKEVATLDLLSDGRLELGIGAGWSEQEYGMMGIPYDAAARRVDKLEEMVAFLKAYFAGEELDVHGEYVNVAGYSGLPRPVQQPHPPFMIGGSRKRVLSLAGREADIVSFANVGFEPVNDAGLTPDEEAVRRCTFARDAAGDRWPDLDVESSPYFAAITDDPRPKLVRLADRFGVATDAMLEHPNVLMGTADAVVETLLARRDRYGVNYVSFQQAQAEEFAPIVAQLAGT